jgi:hypothetical protein
VSPDLGELSRSPFWTGGVRQTESVCAYYLLFLYVVARIGTVHESREYPKNVKDSSNDIRHSQFDGNSWTTNERR